ncbi:DNA (cytosine-5-)-methyltransferase [Chitinophaga sp. Mgbs1]|uniref:DNA (cytosine-5-)-methyltransferase n=1 Tax=Chitinophaga solisilvae TaxID=1233460 RepID=A0A3S1DR16_9BACT|nr:DNA (cytosine-5-)-methyltransferase [Chitinophaga solisilvae]
MKKNKIVAEFFAGIGLMRAGLERAGWATVLANDIDPIKRRLYLNHFKGSTDHFVLEDIHKLSADSIPNVDLATASFPCTDLSLAGRRAGLQGKHSSAFWGFVDILNGMGNRKPPFILLENVAGFLTSNKGEDFYSALSALNNLGYAVDAFIVDAVHFVPQSRVRLFIVGQLRDESKVEVRQDLTETDIRPTKLVKFINEHPQIRWCVNTNLPDLPDVNNNLKKIIDKVSKSSSLWWNADRVSYLLNQTFERHYSKILELKDAKNYAYLTAFRRVRDGKSMAEIRFDGIAGCLRTPKGGSARQILLEVGKGEVNIRLLTPSECAKLMGADDFTLSGTANEALFGFGDAVCVPVVTWIAEHYLNPGIENLHKKKKTDELYVATT